MRSCSYWDIHLERHNAQESLLICIAKGTALQSKIMQWTVNRRKRIGGTGAYCDSPWKN